MKIVAGEGKNKREIFGPQPSGALHETPPPPDSHTPLGLNCSGCASPAFGPLCSCCLWCFCCCWFPVVATVFVTVFAAAFAASVVLLLLRVLSGRQPLKSQSLPAFDLPKCFCRLFCCLCCCVAVVLYLCSHPSGLPPFGAPTVRGPAPFGAPTLRGSHPTGTLRGTLLRRTALTVSGLLFVLFCSWFCCFVAAFLVTCVPVAAVCACRCFWAADRRPLSSHLCRF